MTAYATSDRSTLRGPVRPSSLPGARTPAVSGDALPGIVALYLFTVVVPIGFSLGPIVMTSLRLMLLVLTVPLMIRIWSGHYGRVLLADILFPLHLLWAAVALAANNPDRVVEQVGSLGIEFLGGYAVGRAFVTTPGAFLALARALVLIVCLFLPFVIFELLTARPLVPELIGRLPGISSVRVGGLDPRLGLDRVQAVFDHPIHWGLFCSIAFSLCFVALRETMPLVRRWVLSGLIGLSCFTALSSGALLAMVLQVGLIAWYSVLARQEWRWRAFVALGVLGYVVVDLLSNRTPIQVFMSYATFDPHTAYWRSIIFEWGFANVTGSAEKGIDGSPWLGLGLNDWVRPIWMHTPSVDNFWLLTAMRYGLPGFLLVAAGYLSILVQVMRKDFQADPVLTAIRRAWVFTMIGLAFTLATVHVWSNIYSFVFFFVGAGAWLISASPEATREPSEAGPAPRRPMPFTRFADEPPRPRAARS